MAFTASAKRGRGLVRVEEAAGRAVDRHQLEGHLLPDRHHDLLQLRLGPERDEPHLRAGRLAGEVGRLVERLRRPRVEHGRQHELVLQGRAGRPGDGLERLQRIGDDAAADDDVECAHPSPFVFTSLAPQRGEGRERGVLVLRRVEPARAGAEPMLPCSPVERLRAVPEAGAAVDALLAVEGGGPPPPPARWPAPSRSRCRCASRSPRTRPGCRNDDVVGVAGGRLHLAAHEQRVLVGDEELPVVLDLGPAGRLHERVGERDVLRPALRANRVDLAGGIFPA